MENSKSHTQIHSLSKADHNPTPEISSMLRVRQNDLAQGQVRSIKSILKTSHM